MKLSGVDHVVIDDGRSLAASVRAIWPDGPDNVLDLVGADTTVDSLGLVRRGGTVCVPGMLAGNWVIASFEPVAMIPSGTKLTAFHSDDYRGAAGAAALQRIIDAVEAGTYQPNVDRVFGLDDIVDAHRYMEDNHATGKLVIVP